MATLSLNPAVIRPCVADEAEAVLRLWRESGATPGVTDTVDDLRRVIAEGPAVVLVAEADARLVGSVIGAFDGWRARVYRLAVHPDYRRRGIARALVAAVEALLAGRGAKRVIAEVEKDHPWATGFWAAAGYAADPRVTRFVRGL